MFNYRIIVTVCLGFSFCSFVFSRTPVNTGSKQTAEIPWDVMDGGGGLMCSDSHSIGGSLGQIAAGVCTTTTRIVSAGYWAGIDSLPPCQAGYPCGDANGDTRITGADATYLLVYIYRSGPAPVGQGDVNVDTRITGADATYILSYIYRGGPEPCNPPLGSTSSRSEKRMER